MKKPAKEFHRYREQRCFLHVHLRNPKTKRKFCTWAMMEEPMPNQRIITFMRDATDATAFAFEDIEKVKMMIVVAHPDAEIISYPCDLTTVLTDDQKRKLKLI